MRLIDLPREDFEPCPSKLASLQKIAWRGQFGASPDDVYSYDFVLEYYYDIVRSYQMLGDRLVGLQGSGIYDLLSGIYDRGDPPVLETHLPLERSTVLAIQNMSAARAFSELLFRTDHAGFASGIDDAADTVFFQGGFRGGASLAAIFRRVLLPVPE